LAFALCSTGVWTRGFASGRWALYPLSHASRTFSLFALVILDIGSHFLLRLALYCNPPNLSLPSCQEYRSEPPVPGYPQVEKYKETVYVYPYVEPSNLTLLYKYVLDFYTKLHKNTNCIH
jgi:hypothetical protein